MIRRLLLPTVVTLLVGAWLAPAVSAQPRTFVARLEPSCPAAEEAGARGVAIVRLEDDGTLTYRIVATNLNAPALGATTAAHIHQAPPPTFPFGVIVGLDAPTGGTGAATRSAGTIDLATLTADQRAELLQELNAGTAYVNVHTTVCPGGAIQGTLDEAAAEGAAQ